MLCLLGAGRALLLSPSSSPLLQLAAPPGRAHRRWPRASPLAATNGDANAHRPSPTPSLWFEALGFRV